MKINLFRLFVYLFLLSFIYASAQEKTDSSVRIFEPTAGYICDIGRNFSGGIKEGNAFMGLAYAGVIINSDRLWEGGKLIIEMMNTHGHRLSANYTGDMQVVSNIENGSYTFLYQLRFTQRFSKTHIMFGVQDLNAEFAVSEFSAALTNSSFGIHSSFSLNFPVSIYPKNALAVIGSYKVANGLLIRTGIADSDARSLDDDPHNLDWSIQGLMSITEVELHSHNLLYTTLKIGGYFLTDEYPDPSDTLKSSKGNYGFYFVGDQRLIADDVRGLGIFGQFGYAPKDRNFNTMYVGLGLNFLAPFKKMANDVVACGIAYSKLFDNSYECDIELNYNFNPNKYISIQPAFHYVIHPGANQNLSNAFAGFLRISAGF